MKNTLKPVSVTLYLSLVVLIAVLISGCFMPQDSSPGSVSMNVASARNSMSTAEELADEWVVGIVIDSSFDANLRDLMAQEEYRHYMDAPVSDSVKDLWQDLALKSAVRFEGGRPFFQFKMPRPDGDATGSFSIQGIPANRSYFLYLLVMKDKITSIENFTDYDNLEATTPIHYFDPSDAPSGWSFGRSGGGAPYNVGNPLIAGWYIFTDWSPLYDVDGNMTDLGGTIWTDDDGNPISSQPFTVEAGSATVVRVLLTDYDD